MSKPLVFNYKEYEDLRKAYKELLEENASLKLENTKLLRQVQNLSIKVRIMEEEKR